MQIAQSGMSIRKPPRNPNSALFRMSENLHETIKDLLIEELMLKIPKEEIGDTTLLFGSDGLGLDSIDALSLVVALEKRYGVTVPNSEVARQALSSVDAICKYVTENRKA